MAAPSFTKTEGPLVSWYRPITGDKNRYIAVMRANYTMEIVGRWKMVELEAAFAQIRSDIASGRLGELTL